MQKLVRPSLNTRMTASRAPLTSSSYDVISGRGEDVTHASSSIRGLFQGVAIPEDFTEMPLPPAEDLEHSFLQGLSDVVVDSKVTDYVRTDDLEEATEILTEEGAVVLCGPPGSGKTTLAHALLRRCREEGFRIYVFSDVKDWQTHVCDGRPSAVLMDGILGEVRVDQQQYKHWVSILCGLLELTSQGQCRLVLTLYPHVLRELRELERDSASPLVKRFLTVNLMRSPLSKDVKEQLLSFHLKHLPLPPAERDDFVQEIVQKDMSDAAFPWCCRHMVDLWPILDDPSSVFTRPAEAYVPLLKRMVRDAQHGNTFAALFSVTMKGLGGFLHCPQRVQPHLDELRFEQSSEYHLAEYADVLRDSILGSDGYGFQSRVAYDAVGLALGRAFSMPIVLKICDAQFLVSYIRTKCSASFTINIGTDINVREIFMQQVFDKVMDGQIAVLCQHPCFSCPDFLEEFEAFCSHRKNYLSRFVTAVDSVHGLSLLYWSVWSPSPHLMQWCQNIMSTLSKKTLPGSVLSSALMSVFLLESSNNIDAKAKVMLIELLKSVKVELLLNDTSPLTLICPFPAQRLTDDANLKYERLVHRVETRFLTISVLLSSVTLAENIVSLELTKKEWYMVILLNAQKAELTDEQGNTSLHKAAAVGNREIIKLLVKYGASVTAVNHLGLTPPQISERRWKSREEVSDYKVTMLHHAIKEGDQETVAELLCCCATVHDRLINSSTPLHSASSAGQKEMARLLIQLGANVNAKMFVSNDTPLHGACASGNLDMVRLLVEHGAEVNKLGLSGYTPLHCACYNGNADVIELLIQLGAKVNATTRDVKKTVLHIACTRGHADVIPLLLNHGADVSVQNREGQTAISLARKKGLHGSVKLMEEFLTANDKQL